MGVTSTRRSALHDRNAPLVAIVAALVAAFVAWVVLHHGHGRAADVISDAAFLPINAVAGFIGWRCSRHRGLDVATRRAWSRLAAAYGLWWTADLLWFYFEVVQRSSPFPSLADAFYLAFYPVMLWGLLSFPTARRTGSGRRTLGLDVATVTVGGAMLIWYLVVGPVVHAHHAGALPTALNIAYPTGDLVLLFGLAWVLLRRPAPRATRALHLLAAGTGVFVVADVAYANLSLRDRYHGGDWPDALWAVAQLLLLLAAAAQHHRVSSGAVDVEPPAMPTISRLPYVAMAAGYGLLLRVGLEYARYPFGDMLLGAVVLTGLVVTRQIAALRENVALLNRMHELAATDSLTGLLNRRSFIELLEHALARPARDELAVVMIDVDHFKAVNDTHGHAAGDAVLRAVGTRCRDALRAGDSLARFGGDELIALLPRTNDEEARVVAERLLAAATAAPVMTERGAVFVGLSIGVAAADGYPTISMLLARADGALYDAKKAGKGCVRVASARGAAAQPTPTPTSEPSAYVTPEAKPVTTS